MAKINIVRVKRNKIHRWDGYGILQSDYGHISQDEFINAVDIFKQAVDAARGAGSATIFLPEELEYEISHFEVNENDEFSFIMEDGTTYDELIIKKIIE